MILVDTSVWVEHLRVGSVRLQALLHDDQVLCHPFVMGELACGNLRQREQILGLLGALPEARMAEHDEALHLLDSAHLYGRGLGWVDLHLLSSALISGCGLWSLDRPLQKAAAALQISAS
ncbi:MAG TPA: PIN domain-containing protein [Candidatus Methylomirabilis sp.]|nr:PIN domain-containing protein [Candidatus Methylomirabilis sp.]